MDTPLQCSSFQQLEHHSDVHITDIQGDKKQNSNNSTEISSEHLPYQSKLVFAELLTARTSHQLNNF